MKVLFLFGPNLGALGTRDPERYGRQTLAEIMGDVASRGTALGHEGEWRKAGHEGGLVGAREAAVFLTDGRYEGQSSHEVPDLERRIYLDERSGHLARALGDLGVHRAGFEREGLTYGEWQRLTEAVGDAELVPTGSVVEELRRVKDAEEVTWLDRAQEAADV